MNKNFIYLLAVPLIALCMLVQVPAQVAAKKAETQKQNHGTTVKHIERDMTGAAKNIENKIEQHGVKKYKEKVKQDKIKKQAQNQKSNKSTK